MITLKWNITLSFPHVMLLPAALHNHTDVLDGPFSKILGPQQSV